MILVPKVKYQQLLNHQTEDKQSNENPEHRENENHNKSDSPDDIKQAIEMTLPKTRQQKGLNLYAFLKRQDKNVLSWTENGQLIYKGQIIPHTHIVDLIRDAVVSTKSLPNGKDEFYQALQMFHTPQGMIANPLRKHLDQLIPVPTGEEKSKQETTHLKQNKPIQFGGKVKTDRFRGKNLYVKRSVNDFMNIHTWKSINI